MSAGVSCCRNLVAVLVKGAAVTGREGCGAWILLVEVSALDPSAPSWEFLQVCIYLTQCWQPHQMSHLQLACCLILYQPLPAALMCTHIDKKQETHFFNWCVVLNICFACCAVMLLEDSCFRFQNTGELQAGCL